MDELRFRDELYARYVSTFKGVDGAMRDPGAAEAGYAWFRYRYLPLLDSCERFDPVLELGCGDGTTLDYLRRAGFADVTGVDVSAEQVQLAAARGLTAERADVFEYLSAKKGVYGTVVALDFVEHFTKDEVVHLLRSVARALRPGGLLLLQTPNGQGLFPGQVIYGDFGHLTILTPDSLSQVLRIAGFTDIRMVETGPVPDRWEGKARMLLWRGIRCVANGIRWVETGKIQTVWTENIVCACRVPAAAAW